MSSQNRRIAIVLTSHDKLGNTGEKTGFHWEEMVTPYYTFLDAGFEIDIASIKGGNPPYDPGSLATDSPPASGGSRRGVLLQMLDVRCWMLEKVISLISSIQSLISGAHPPNLPRQQGRKKSKCSELVKHFLQDETAMEKLQNSLPITQVNPEDCDAVFIPGGYGTMWDLPENKTLQNMISDMHADGKIIAAICHGPAALTNVIDKKTREPLVKGKRINCFTNEEEIANEKAEIMPFLLETRLRELGAEFHNAGVFQECVVQDGNLITGQNPASAKKLAEMVVETLRKI